MNSKISVIIVTYNGSKWVDSCFSSLRRSMVPLQVIVVDNGSTDDTLARIESHFPEVHMVKTGKNLGFGKANNIGIEIAYQQGAEYFFLLNQDAWIEPDTVDALITTHLKHPAYGIISPMHMNGAGDALDYKFSIYIAPNRCDGLYSDIFIGKLKEIYEVPFVNAAAWSITRQCIEKVGGFSPSFFHYGEDDNYTQRMHYHGLKLGVVPTARISHDREQRPVSKFFESAEAFRRELIQRSSNPMQEISFAREWISIAASLVLSVLRMKRSKVNVQIMKLRQLASIDKKSIIANRERSKQTSATFLNLHAVPQEKQASCPVILRTVVAEDERAHTVR